MEDKERQNTQEVQEDMSYTSEEIRAAMERNGVAPERIRDAMGKLLPEEYQKKLIHSAAISSGRNEEELPIEEAVVLLQLNSPTPEISKILDSVSKQAAADFFEAVPEEQIKALTVDLVTGKLAPEIMDALDKVEPYKITRKHGVPDIQEVQKAIGDISDLLKEATGPATNVLRVAIDAIGEQLRQLSEVFRTLQEQTPPEVLERMEAWDDDIKILLPFIEQEIQDRKEDPRCKDLNAIKLIAEQVSADGVPETDLALEILLSARSRRATEDFITREIRQAIEDPAIKPKKYVSPNDALTNKLYSGALAINAGAFDLPLINERNITAYTIITDDRDENGEPTGLTGRARCVEDAIVSIWEEAETRHVPPVFTAKSIYRAMPGGGSKPTPEREKEIEEAVETLWTQFDEVDYTDYARTKNIIEEGKGLKFKEHRLNLRECTITHRNGGTESKGWLILSEPLGLRTGKLTGQIVRVPYKYLTIHETDKGKVLPAVISMGAERQAITAYLVRRIETMRKDEDNANEKKRNYDRTRAGKDNPKEVRDFRNPKVPRTILFDTIYENAGIEAASKQNAAKYRQFVLDVLEYYKLTGYIRDYRKQTKGRAIPGVEITI